MNMRMLIDATHAEETRVVILRGKRLEAFDFESASKRQLKGNIYLAKVTRVEPSLQAAFVDYGGNRHGFLAFNEIHPDYYQIPVEDRQALLEAEAQQATEDAARDDEAAANLEASADLEEPDEENDDDDENVVGDDLDGSDALDEVPRPRARPKRSYKIQEVIKRRQILLVQIVKEERGNKGAALTTYLSLAGRYCVLMPNTARGGGISRKISNQVARSKLKRIVSDLSLPDGMGVIVRTAGMNRTKTEIKRDFEYLVRVWDEVRENTLVSTAPTLVYEEANLVKRTIRDHYSKEIDEILVDGEAGYRTAKDFMRSMQPSHAKKVQLYRGRVPLLHRYQVEQQLDQMHSNIVQLKSGGYIVLSPTEALVAIDVNSGRSTKEHNIEETALKTNLEASEEIARQLRLRDLAGLIVIDYIDMGESKHCRQVERRLKESLKIDRARLQVGRISSFGLLEMSRQRLRPSLFEASTVPCAVCAGTGFVRSTESTVLHVLRTIEEEGIRAKTAALTVKVPLAVAIYILNQKRDALIEIERRYGMRVRIFDDPDLVPPNLIIEVDEARSAQQAAKASKLVEEAEAVDQPEAIEPEATEPEATEPEATEPEATEPEATELEATEPEATEPEAEVKKPRRRRRRRRRGEDEALESKAVAGTESAASSETDEKDAEATAASDDKVDTPENSAENGARRRRRRGRRGGGRRKRTEGESRQAEADGNGETSDMTADAPSPEPDTEAAAPAADENVPPSPVFEPPSPEPGDAPLAAATEAVPQEMPTMHTPVEFAAAETQNNEPEPATLAATTVEDTAVVPSETDAKKPKRRGWWQRKVL